MTAEQALDIQYHQWLIDQIMVYRRNSYEEILSYSTPVLESIYDRLEVLYGVI